MSKLDRIGQSLGKLAENSPLAFSLVAVLLLQTLVILAFHPSYATNDDVFITMIASGKGLCPEPDAHLIFTNVIIGEGLRQLYTAYPAIPWYGCYLLLVHQAAQVAIFYCALTIGRRPGANPNDVGLRCGLYLLYYALVELALLNRMQFTTTAFLATQAGIFLWLLAWQRRILQKDAAVIGPLAAAVLLLFLGGIIRLESLAMAVLVAVPVGLMLLRQFSRAAVLPCGTALVVAAALIAAATAYDGWTYEHDPNWRGFRHLNQVRGVFHDFRWTSYTPETAAVFSQVGWSENDHAMIANWFSDDPVIYSEPNLTKVVEAYPWAANRQMAAVARQSFRDIARHRSVLSVLLVLPFVIAVVRERRAKWAIGLSCAAAFTLIVFVAWHQKVPPERVFFPLLSFPLAVALLSFAWRRDLTSSSDRTLRWLPFAWSARSLQTSVVFGLLVTAIVMGLHHQIRQSVKVQRGRLALQSFLDELRTAERKLVVSWEAALPYELVSPLDNLSSWSHIPILSLAWTQRTPWHEEIKRQFGISNLSRALYERDDIVLVAKPIHRAAFTKFAKEHFNADVKFVASRELGPAFVAGNFQRQTAPGNTADRRRDAVQR